MSVWRHERRGSYRLARLICLIRGCDFATWVDEDGETWRGDCRRCWA